MAKIRCEVCGDQVHEELLTLHQGAERWWLARLRREHPEWVEADGSCPRCLDYFKKMRHGQRPQAA